MCPLIPNTGLLVVAGTWKCKTSLQGSRNPRLPQKITIPTSIIQHREELKVYEVYDQLFTQLHALLTWQAGTFIWTLFTLFTRRKQEKPADITLWFFVILWMTLMFVEIILGGWVLSICVWMCVHVHALIAFNCHTFCQTNLFSSLHWLPLAQGQIQHYHLHRQYACLTLLTWRG